MKLILPRGRNIYNRTATMKDWFIGSFVSYIGNKTQRIILVLFICESTLLFLVCFE